MNSVPQKSAIKTLDSRLVKDVELEDNNSFNACNRKRYRNYKTFTEIINSPLINYMRQNIKQKHILIH